MAEAFTIRGQETVLQFRGSVDAEEVQQFTVEAKPSGIWFNARITQDEVKRGALEGTLAAIAKLYNTVAATPGIVGVSTYDDLDFNNRIVPKLSLTIASTSGDSTITRNDLDFRNGIGALQGAIADQVAQLDAQEAL